MDNYRMMHVLQAPQLKLILTRVLATRMVRRRCIMKLMRSWMNPCYMQRNAPRHLDTIVQEHFNDNDTLSFLPMCRTDFEHLLRLIEPKIRRVDTNMRRAISPQERLLITLRFLATGESYTSLQRLIQVSRRSFGRIVPKVCEAIIGALREYVQLPSTQDEWLKVAREFENRWNFPHAIGAMSGKRVKIQTPKNELYTNQVFRSIVLLAVCDAEYNFMYADVGWQDRLSGGEIFQTCSMFPSLENKALNIPDAHTLCVPDVEPVPYTFLADEAFAPMTDYTLCPFTDIKEDDTSSAKINFNRRFTAAHSVIENAMGILFSRFRVLLGPIQLEPGVVKSLVLASVYLHNFLRKGQSANMYMPPGSIDRMVDGNVVRGAWRTDPVVSAAIGLNLTDHKTTYNCEEPTNIVRMHLANVLNQL